MGYSSRKRTKADSTIKYLILSIIFLQAVLGEASEVLPLYNKRTSQTYSEVKQSVNQMKDWSSASYYDGHGHGYLRGNAYKVRRFSTCTF